MSDSIETPIGVVVGIGKLKVFTIRNFPHPLPTLSFIVAKGNDGIYTATCIQLLLDYSTASSPNEAIEGLSHDCSDFLNELFSDTSTKYDAVTQLKELFKSPVADVWTHAYREAQIQLALQDIDME